MFSILNGGKYFYQWDLGQKLVVNDNFCKVHFCNATGGALVVDVVEEDGVRVAKVPNILLQSTDNIRVYGVCKADNETINTRDYQIFRVIPRGKPEEYVFTEEDVFTYEALEARVEALENGAGLAGDGGVPFVVNGYMEYEATSSEYYDGNVIINVEVEEDYNSYKIGDSFLINIINTVDELPVNMRTASIEKIYIKVNSLDRMMLFDSRNNSTNNIYLLSLNSLIVICRKDNTSNDLLFYAWGDSLFNTSSPSGEMAEESGKYKVIGFTEDCDYVATAEDGLSAFQQALEEANENDIILVNSGTYKSNTIFNITKNITFVAVGNVVIDLPIWIQGGGTFSYENWEWENVYESKHATFYNFVFNKRFDVGLECNPDNMYYNGFATVKNSTFKGEAVVVGDFSNCAFYGGITVGHYYGSSTSRFNGCFFNCSITANNSDYFTNCDFNFKGTDYVNITAWNEETFKGCKMYAPNDILIIYDSHSSDFYLNDTVIFAAGFVFGSDGNASGGFLVKTESAINH